MSDSQTLRIDVHTKLDLRGGFVRFMTKLLTEAGITGLVLMHVDHNLHGAVRYRESFQLRGFESGINTRLVFRAQAWDLNSRYGGRLFFTRLSSLVAAEKLVALPNVTTMGDMSELGTLDMVAEHSETLISRGKKVTDDIVDQMIGLLALIRFVEGDTLDWPYIRDAVRECMTDSTDVHEAERRARTFAASYLTGTTKAYQPTAKLIERMRKIEGEDLDFSSHALEAVAGRITTLNGDLQALGLGGLEKEEALRLEEVQNARAALARAETEYTASTSAANQARETSKSIKAELSLLTMIEGVLRK